MANRARLRTVDTLLPEYLENPFPEAAALKSLPAATASRLFCPLLPSYSGLPGFPPPWRL